MEKCQEAHKEAVLALAWMAPADGIISRQELRIIINFCINQGVHAEQSELQAIEELNKGLNMKTTGGESAALENIKSLMTRPLTYRAAFLGAAEAIAAANKTVNASKKRALNAARELISS
jgi:hypothetical protein